MRAKVQIIPSSVDKTLGSRRSLWGTDPLLTGSFLFCVFLLLLAFIGPFVTPYDPEATDLLSAGLLPSLEHPLGTDGLGRDIFSRILAGARLSLLAPAMVALISTTLGVLVALSAAWWGGAVDSVITKIINVMFSVPGILVAIVAVASFGAGFWPPVIALSLVYIPYIAKILKGPAAQLRKRPFVEAFQLSGMSAFQITSKHILINLMPLILAQATLNFGAALIDYGALSFLGLGVPPPAAEWGSMVSEGRTELLTGYPQQSAAAGVAIVLTVVAFNLLGERISRRMGAFS